MFSGYFQGIFGYLSGSFSGFFRVFFPMPFPGMPFGPFQYIELRMGERGGARGKSGTRWKSKLVSTPCPKIMTAGA